MKIGFIGLGNMGGPMALNLARAGHSMTVHDLRREAGRPLEEMGAARGRSPSEVARGSEMVLTSLPGPAEVEQVALGKDGILQGIGPGSVYIDLSTSSPTLIRRIAETFKEKGVDVMDAPVSGGVPGAREGKLAVLCGGDKAIYERCKPVLDAIGDKVQHCGGIGCGTICKLVHNAIIYCFMQAVGECFTAGVKAGVEPEVVWRAVRDGAMGRGVPLHDSIPRKLFRGDFEPDFALKLAKKDVALAAELGREYGVPMPVVNMALGEINEAMGRGWGDRDSRIMMVLQEERAGVKLRSRPSP